MYYFKTKVKFKNQWAWFIFKVTVQYYNIAELMCKNMSLALSLKDCHAIDHEFNPCLWQKKGYPCSLTAVQPNCVNKGRVLYMADFGHGQDKKPLRLFEKSRE